MFDGERFLYNEDLKMRYIKRFTSKKSQYVITRFFMRTGPYEADLGLDLCQMSVNQIETLIADLATGASSQQYSLFHYINGYCKWCVGEKILGAKNVVKECEFDGSDNIRKNMVVSPSHLLVRLEQDMDHMIDEHTPDNIARMYFWFAYMGLTEVEAATVTNDNIDLKTMTVTIGNNAYPIYRECLPALLSCMERTKLNIFLNGKSYERDRVPGNRVLRSSASPRGVILDDNDPQVLTLRVRKSVINSSAKFSYRNIRKSGAFRRAYESEIISPTSDPVTVFRSFVISDFRQKTLDDHKDNPKRLRKLISAKCKSMYEDYCQWLLAFGL